MGRQQESGFLAMVQANRGIIYKICNAYCKNKSDREDLVQEIIYQLWKSGKSFNEGQTFTTWMYRVALNVAISFYRRQKQAPAALPFTDIMEDIEDAKDASTVTEDNIKLLQRFINELKELDRALMLLYLEAKSYAEIAEIIGITETNVATKISRIKEKLKQRFEHSG
jgi:RNA polymerase sigma-70 factor (ECF subfamily)